MTATIQPAVLARLAHVVAQVRGPVLLVGVDVRESEQLMALLATFPTARVVSFSDDVGAPKPQPRVEVMPKDAWKAFRALWSQSFDTIIALHDYRNLTAFTLAMRAERRFVVRHGALCRLDGTALARNLLGTATRRIEREWFNLAARAAVGAGNDYGFIEERLHAAGPFPPRLRASVIVPVYNRTEILTKTLAGLALQSYPRELFEVIVADDGSHDHPETVVDAWAERLDIRIVRQEDLGYRLSAVRNLAARAATGEVLISLDCDMLPEPDFLAHHLMWFHVWSGPLVVVGYRRHIDTNGLTAGDILRNFDVVREAPSAAAPAASRHRSNPADDWRRPVIRKTRSLKDHPAPYAVASGGNLGYWRRDVLAIGGHDETFDHWGGEDDEFGYRMQRLGAYFVPEPRALAYHQDHPAPVDRETHRKTTRVLLGRKVPHYRHFVPDRGWDSPLVSVYVPVYNGAAFIRRAVDSALAQTLSDLEICVCDDGSTDDTPDVLARTYSTNRRVRFMTVEHGGTAHASNAAVAMCRGEFILQLDADDELLPDAARVLADVLRRDPKLALAYAGYEQVGPEGEVQRKVVPGRYQPYDHIRGMVVTHPRMFRARDFHRAGGWDESIASAEDLELSLRLAEQGHVRSIPRVLYRYWVHGANHSLVQRAAQRHWHERIVDMARVRRRL